MNATAKHLRARIAEVLKQGTGGRRYGAERKRAMVDYALARQGEGATIRVIAEEIGLSEGLLGKWLRHARLRLVVVARYSRTAARRRCTPSSRCRRQADQPA